MERNKAPPRGLTLRRRQKKKQTKTNLKINKT